MSKIKIRLVMASLLFSSWVMAQSGEEVWSLQKCIDYAQEHNLQIQIQQTSKDIADEEMEQTKAQQYPTLNFSTSHNVTFQNKATSYNEYMEQGSRTSYSGNYGLNSSVTLYNGGKIRNSIKQAQIQQEALQYDVEQSKADIVLQVAQAYLQVLYDNESLKLNRQAADLSKLQVERAQQMLEAGSVSNGDVAQLESQWASDMYQITLAENTLSYDKLQLKQLLELTSTDAFEVAFPTIAESDVVAAIPSVESVYQVALSAWPEMKSSQLNIQSAEVAVAMAKASALPTVSMSAGISTGTYSGTGIPFIDQLNNKMNESMGVSLSLPLINGKQAKVGVSTAKLQTLSAMQQDLNTCKQLLSTIESLHNDVVSYQSQYISATEQLRAAGVSYEIVNEQFNAGLKNTVELITEKNNYSDAQTQQLQAKYQAVLALQLLNVYQNQPISL